MTSHFNLLTNYHETLHAMSLIEGEEWKKSQQKKDTGERPFKSIWAGTMDRGDGEADLSEDPVPCLFKCGGDTYCYSEDEWRCSDCDAAWHNDGTSYRNDEYTTSSAIKWIKKNYNPNYIFIVHGTGGNNRWFIDTQGNVYYSEFCGKAQLNKARELGFMIR